MQHSIPSHVQDEIEAIQNQHTVPGDEKLLVRWEIRLPLARIARLPGPGGALGDEVVAGEDELGDGEDALVEEGRHGARARDPLHRPLVELVHLLLHLHPAARRRRFASARRRRRRRSVQGRGGGLPPAEGRHQSAEADPNFLGERTNKQTEIKREVKALKLRRRRADLEDESETGRRF
jgi:hypothetical protein